MNPAILGIASLFLLASLAHAQAGPPPGSQLEVTSPLGTKFYSLPDEKEVVAAAQKNLQADPKSVDLLLKLAQAQATVWQYREAVDTCTRALAIAPSNAAVYLERGHRELGLREFTQAREDLNRAVSLDSKKMDGYYHLGLSHYFLGEFAESADAFRLAVELAPDDAERINSSNWLYASLRRAKKPDEAARALAAIPADMKTSGHSQFYLNLVRFFQGTMKESEVLPPEPPKDSTDIEAELQFDTVAYGVGNWYVYNGDLPTAYAYFRRIVTGHVWVTWGFIGAEREVVRSHVVKASD